MRSTVFEKLPDPRADFARSPKVMTRAADNAGKIMILEVVCIMLLKKCAEMRHILKVVEGRQSERATASYIDSISNSSHSSPLAERIL